MKVQFITFILLFFCSTILGQDVVYRKNLSKKDKKQYNKAVVYQKELKLDKALKTFDKLLAKNPNLVEALARKASIYYQQKKFEQSIYYFQAAITASPKKDKRLYYSLGLAAKEHELWDIAIKAFDQYLVLCLEKNKIYYKIEALREQCVFTKKAMNNPVPFKPVRLSEAINTKDSEYLPAFTADGAKMIFTRRIANQEDFFESTIEDTIFKKAIFLESLNTVYNEGAHAISVDGNYLVYTVCNQRQTIGSCDLWQSRKINSGWTIPASMGDFINSISWDAQPSLSADGQSLYFASKRRGGYGGSDIWVSSKNSRGKWNAPKNLSESINRTGNQESPYIHPDGKTLYFRSNTHPGMGDFDLFVSKKDSLGIWGEPINLGFPINTPESQGGLHVSLDGSTAYFASDHHFKPGDPNRNLDIFKFEMYEEIKPNPSTYLKISVFDAASKRPIPAEVIIKDLNTDQKMLAQNIGPYQPLLTTLTTEKNYFIAIKSDEYIYHSENINLDSTRIALDPYILDVYLSRLPNDNTEIVASPKPSRAFILQNIFFETGKAVLKEISYEEIKRLANQLKSHPHLSIKITGHTDNIGHETDNMKLSIERAKAVYHALVLEGVGMGRISYTGRGELDPIDTNDKEQGRQNNRRTEFILK